MIELLKLISNVLISIGALLIAIIGMMVIGAGGVIFLILLLVSLPFLCIYYYFIAKKQNMTIKEFLETYKGASRNSSELDF